MFFPSIGVGEEEAVFGYGALTGEYDEGYEDERREEGVEQEHGYDGVALEGFLLKDVVEA